MEMYPLKFGPIYKERIWGSRQFADFFGRDIPDGKIGESWELADLPDDKSVIANGELAGLTLNEAVAKYPEEITGDADFEPPFPLLIKFLDAQDDLSVQVHPDPATCERMGKGDPKTECWYVISAEADSVLYKGLKKGVTREQFSAAIEAGTVDELMEVVPVKAGQCHFLPAGTAHSIGAGLLIAEIQTPSDTTYRVFDWNRVDQSGKGRQLHIAEALESIAFGTCGSQLAVTTIGRLVDCEYFTIDKGHQAKGCELLWAGGKMRILMFLNGGGAIENSAGQKCDFKAGETILSPSGYEGVVKFAEDTEYLTVRI
jgi:mannose-6-phosphate isomerase